MLKSSFGDREIGLDEAFHLKKRFRQPSTKARVLREIHLKDLKIQHVIPKFFILYVSILFFMRRLHSSLDNSL
jgi:hypothetical protein